MVTKVAHEGLQLNVHKLYQKSAQVLLHKSVPSHTSVHSMTLFPQNGGTTVGILEQFDVSNEQEAQRNIQVSNHWLTHVSPAKSLPSHCSPVSIIPFPQAGIAGQAGSLGTQIRFPLMSLPAVQSESKQSQASPVFTTYSVLVYANPPHAAHAVRLENKIS